MCKYGTTGSLFINHIYIYIYIKRVCLIDAHNVVYARCTTTHWTLYSIQWISNSGITHSILQFTECLYYGHSTPALRTRVRAAALVSNDPGLRFTEERTSQIPGIFRPCVQFRRRPIYGRFAGITCTNVFQFQELLHDISNGISQIMIYIITVIVCWKIIIVQEDSIKFGEIKLRISFSIFDIEKIVWLSTIWTRRIFDSKSKKSLFPFSPLCEISEYRLQFVSRIFGSEHRSLAKLGSIGDEMGKFARRAPRAK